MMSVLSTADGGTALVKPWCVVHLTPIYRIPLLPPSLECTIGSLASKCNIVLDDPDCSGTHCRIVRTRRGVEIEDVCQARSAVCTYVDGNIVSKGAPTLLSDGAEVRIGHGGRLSFKVYNLEPLDPTGEESIATEPASKLIDQTFTRKIQMEQALSCAICHSLFHQCVSLTPCMHSFCAGCVAQSLARSRNGSCPICRATVTNAQPNRAIRDAVGIFASDNPTSKRLPQETESLDKHSEGLSSFFERRGRRRVGDATRDGDQDAQTAAEGWNPPLDERVSLNAMLQQSSVDGNLQRMELSLACGADVHIRDRSERTPVHLAAINGHDESIRKLLDSGAALEPLDQQGQTPLCMAAEYGHVNVVRVLLSKGAQVNEMTPHGDLPLHIATEMGHNPVVETLLAANAQVDAHDGDGNVPLALGCLGGHLGCVRTLLQVGADVNGSPGDNSSPLLHAVDEGHEAVVKELLATPGIQVDRRRFSDGCTALYSASAKGHIGIVRCLLEAGADFKLTCAETDVSPLMIAAYHSRLEVVQELLEVGADPNIGSTDGATAIFYAAQKGHLEVIRILLDAGADPDKPKVNGATSLCIASYHGHVELVRELLAAGANVVTENTARLFALWFANQGKRTEVARILLEAGTPPDQVGPNGNCLLFEAADLGNHEIADMLLQKGAEVNRPAPVGGETALSMACHLGQVEVIRTLIRHGADVNRRMPSDGWETPLILAVMSKSGAIRVEMARELIAHGANVNLRRTDHRTALDIAHLCGEEGKSELVELLSNAGGKEMYQLAQDEGFEGLPDVCAAGLRWHWTTDSLGSA